MLIIRHYELDGDMLTDEIAQVHRSPGFITSTLVGKRDDGTMIKEHEASHGTVTDLWDAHLRGEETSLNPLGLVDALVSSMNHSAQLHSKSEDQKKAVLMFTKNLMKALHNTFRYGQGTRDMAGPTGSTTENFVDKVAWRLGRYVAAEIEESTPDEMIVPSRKFRRNYNVDKETLQRLFAEYDTEKKGSISIDGLENLLATIGVAPMSDPLKRGSASKDKPTENGSV